MHFSYLYTVPTHKLVYSPKYVMKILVHIINTSVDAHINYTKFANTLLVLLGPNVLMEKYGK